MDGLTYFLRRALIVAPALVFIAASALAQSAGSVKISSNPSTPAANVYIDGNKINETPADIKNLAPGVHTIRVTREGTAIEKRVLIKAGTSLELVADFLKPGLVVQNQNAIGYDPIREKAKLTFGPAGVEPKAPEPTPVEKISTPAEPPVTAPPFPAEPAKEPPAAEKHERTFTPEGEKKPEPDGKVENEPATDIAPGASAEKPAPEPEIVLPEGWSPIPPPGKMGPPIPPAIKEKLEMMRMAKASAATGDTAGPPQPADGRTTVTFSAAGKTEKPAEPIKPAEEKKPETTATPPCRATGRASSCAEYNTGIRGAVYAYYCFLAENDFDAAYDMRVTSRDKAWFYNVSKTFCNVYGFNVRGFATESSTGTEAVVTYHVDLLSEMDQVIETWSMKTSLVKRGGQWKILSTAGAKI